MTYSQFYYPTVVPQWLIFLGVVAIIAGYVDKKEFWTRTGWIIFIIAGLTSLYFNLFGDFSAEENVSSAVASLKTSGWLCFTGGILAAIALFFQRTKRKNYKVLAVLILIYFMLIFFQFNHLSSSLKMVKKSLQETEQGK
jgi:drug/metabolite transporter (DMT)-like permease